MGQHSCTAKAGQDRQVVKHNYKVFPILLQSLLLAATKVLLLY